MFGSPTQPQTRLSRVSFLTTIVLCGGESSLACSGRLSRSSHAAQLDMSCQSEGQVVGLCFCTSALTQQSSEGNRRVSRH